MKTLILDDHIHTLLLELAQKRRDNNEIIRSMKDVVGEAVIKLHKKEVG